MSQKPSFEESLASFDDKEKLSCWSDKNILRPEQVFKYSNKKFIFDCNKCKHEFSKVIAKITSKDSRWCPYCVNQQLCENKDCKTCYNKTFQSVLDTKTFVIWHTDNKVNPINVFKFSPKKFNFYCDFCDKKYEKYVYDISYQNNCNFCNKCKYVRLCKNKDCEFCFNRSFASSIYVQNWSDQNIKTPIEVLKNTDENYMFYCKICNHSFEKNLKNLYNGNNICSYCNICNFDLCGKKNCNHCFIKSLANNDIKIIHSWSSKNQLNPYQVARGSKKFFLFNCFDCNNEFFKKPDDISKGSWCPVCKNKTEKKVYEFLKNEYALIKNQAKFDWCKKIETNYYLLFDILINDYNIIIEIDGEQHFKQVSNWKAPEIAFKNDIYKMLCANKNNFSMIRITQEDVYGDKIDWKKLLKESIEQIKLKNSIENHFISFKENIYDEYIKKINELSNTEFIEESTYELDEN
jgi:very-short-patch-repair endonuclease